MTPQQQQQQEAMQRFEAEMFKERDKRIVSWTNEMREWYPTAISALDFASLASLQCPMSKYGALLEKEPQGLNMNVVAILSNNLELRTPAEMGWYAQTWARVLELNLIIATAWNATNGEIRQLVTKRFEISAGVPKLSVVN